MQNVSEYGVVGKKQWRDFSFIASLSWVEIKFKVSKFLEDLQVFQNLFFFCFLNWSKEIFQLDKTKKIFYNFPCINKFPNKKLSRRAW